MILPRFALLCVLLALVCIFSWPSPLFSAEPTTIVGSDEDDLLLLDTGDYTVYGGAGTDTAVVPFFPNTFRLSRNGPDQYLAHYQGQMGSDQDKYL